MQLNFYQLIKKLPVLSKLRLLKTYAFYNCNIAQNQAHTEALLTT